MNNKFAIFSIIILLQLVFSLAEPTNLSKIENEKNCTELAKRFSSLLESQKNKKDLSEFVQMNKSSKREFDKGNYDKCQKILEEGIKQLYSLSNPQITESIPEPKMESTQINLNLPTPLKKVQIVYYNNAKDHVSSPAQDIDDIFIKEEKTTIKKSLKLPVTFFPTIIYVPKSTKIKITKFTNQLSPFGISNHDLFIPEIGTLGINWTRLEIVWDAEEPKKGVYQWERFDRSIKSYDTSKINIVCTILSFNQWDLNYKIPQKDKSSPDHIPKTMLPRNIELYSKFIKKVVERYDGDGVDDCPGSPVINYWQIGNEPDGPSWADSPENFAKLVKITATSIKEANPNAKILLGGIAAPQGFLFFYKPMLKSLAKFTKKDKKQYFDIIDLHWSTETGGNYYKTKNHTLDKYLTLINSEFKKNNFKKPQIWITEMSSYSGSPFYGQEKLPFRSEIEHGAELIKSYVYALSMGVKKVFWIRVLEHHNWGNSKPNNYWDKTGLIHNPKNTGASHKKIAYFGYKLIKQILENSDLDNIKIIINNDAAFAVRLEQENRYVYIAWKK